MLKSSPDNSISSMALLAMSSMGSLPVWVSPMQPHGKDTGKMPVRLMGGTPMLLMLRGKIIP